jgi:hypothetical protein
LGALLSITNKQAYCQLTHFLAHIIVNFFSLIFFNITTSIMSIISCEYLLYVLDLLIFVDDLSANERISAF